MLRFYARPGHVCAFPGPKYQGQPARYIGRTTKVTRDAAGKVTQIAHPALAEAIEIDPSGDVGRRVLRLMRIEADKPLWPADEATAKACGVPYVPVELSDGEWLPKSVEPPKRSSKPSPEKGADQ